MVAVKDNRRMPPKRKPPKNQGKPIGDFAEFLCAWLDRKHEGSAIHLAASLKVSPRTVQHWMSGDSAPSFNDLERVAEAMGYGNWFALVAAVRKYHNK